MPLQLLIVGQMARAEAVPLGQWISQTLQAADIKQYVRMADALSSLQATGWIPDLIVIVQSWPEEQTRREIDRLTCLAPLARWVVGFGSWCESDGRTRDLWPLAVRVPLRSAAARVQREWRMLSGDHIAPFPMSASREETFANDHPSFERASISVSVVINSPDPEYKRYLSESVSAAGFSLPTDNHGLEREASDGTRRQVLLFDVDPWCSQRQAEFHQLVRQFPNHQIVGLMNLPSPDQTAEFKELGLVDVLPKLGDWHRIQDAVEGRTS